MGVGTQGNFCFRGIVRPPIFYNSLSKPGHLVMSILQISIALRYPFIKNQFHCATVGRGPNRAFFKAAFAKEILKFPLVAWIRFCGIYRILSRVIAVHGLSRLAADRGSLVEYL